MSRFGYYRDYEISKWNYNRNKRILNDVKHQLDLYRLMFIPILNLMDCVDTKDTQTTYTMEYPNMLYAPDILCLNVKYP